LGLYSVNMKALFCGAILQWRPGPAR
jgi:hypothetical protein